MKNIIGKEDDVTVKELIEELKKYDENIYVHQYHERIGWYYDSISKDELKVKEIEDDRGNICEILVIGN